MIRWSSMAIVLALIAAACSDDGTSAAESSDIETYVSAWSAAWSAGDPHEIARFYDSDVDVRLAQSDRELTLTPGLRVATRDGAGVAWLAGWIDTSTQARERRAAALALDDESAVVVQAIAELETAAWVEMVVRSDLIVEQTTLRWRYAFRPGGSVDGRFEWLDELIADELDQYWASASVLMIDAGDRRAPAIFVVPGAEPTGAGVVVETEDCLRAFWLQLEDRKVVGRRKLASPDCGPVPGRWSGIGVPGPIEDRLTGSVRVGDIDVPLYSGSPDLAPLVEWGLARFDAFGLAQPRAASITFAPNPLCPLGQAGLARSDASGATHLVLCTDAHAACEPDRASCTSFTLTARFGLLHELAHVWLRDELDPLHRADYAARFGLPVWDDPTDPWGRRGVEHASEIIAWALVDEPIELVRIGRPSCEDAASGFTFLTGVELNDRCGPRGPTS